MGVVLEEMVCYVDLSADATLFRQGHGHRGLLALLCESMSASSALTTQDKTAPHAIVVISCYVFGSSVIQYGGCLVACVARSSYF